MCVTLCDFLSFSTGPLSMPTLCMALPYHLGYHSFITGLDVYQDIYLNYSSAS